MIDRHRQEYGGEYRFATEGEHPVASLREAAPREMDYRAAVDHAAPVLQEEMA